jgi:2-keto-4-pentenoate hydratase/2-oxohepta-3-ene-1,7-dioic acid hydratase in catechol pathway
MRLARYRIRGEEPTRIGVVEGDEVSEIGGVDPDHETGVVAALALLRSSEQPPSGRTHGEPHPLGEVELLAPVRRPPKFLAIGLNYQAHVDETGRERPDFPTFFNKQSTCVTGPHSPIHIPPESSQVDYEGELGLVIGRYCRRVRAEDARDVIAGYLVVDDVSARDWQYRAPTWTLGKSWDTHGPIGPWLVTADEIDDPQDLRIRTFVNDDLRQDASTRQMIFSCYEQVAILSTVCTLEPGDIVATGTPAGVGMARNPPEFLGAGDVVRVEIDRIGTIDNPVMTEPSA